MKKKFAYCIGGCRSVPPFLKDLTTDRSDCYAIFFKEPGPDGTIFLPNSTTNTGRNECYRRAKEVGYDYYIMMDDDVEFAGMSHAEGFRKFEALLDEFNPAIGVPRYSWHLHGQNPYSQLDLNKRVQGLGAGDAIVNAFHHSCSDLFLPYWTGADHDCWWDAQQVVHRLAAFLIPGGFVQFNDLSVVNLESGAYPRGAKDCHLADAYVESMTRPDWKAHLEKYKHKNSFHHYQPLLRRDYRMTALEVGQFFDIMHEYWLPRF